MQREVLHVKKHILLQPPKNTGWPSISFSLETQLWNFTSLISRITLCKPYNMTTNSPSSSASWLLFRNKEGKTCKENTVDHSPAWSHINTCLNPATLSHANNTISLCHYRASKLNHQVSMVLLFSPSWCLSLCTGLTHPTTLSFGTLHILLPAPANLANVLSFYLPSSIFLPSSMLINIKTYDIPR